MLIIGKLNIVAVKRLASLMSPSTALVVSAFFIGVMDCLSFFCGHALPTCDDQNIMN
jgi:hypothetical protein